VPEANGVLTNVHLFLLTRRDTLPKDQNGDVDGTKIFATDMEVYKFNENNNSALKRHDTELNRQKKHDSDPKNINALPVEDW
jgi:hypothetical protein